MCLSTSGEGNEHALVRLKETLKHIQRFKDKAGVVQEALDEYISTSLHLTVPLQNVQAQLQKLYQEESLISKDLCKQAEEMAAKVFAQSAEECGEIVASKDKFPSSSMPLFCKDTVYHAGTCSLAVTSCTAGDYQKLFKDREKVPGHTFQEISISRSKQDRYLIARQDGSTYYFAFQSEPSLLEWPKQFKSFYEGTSLVVRSYILPTALLHNCRTAGPKSEGSYPFHCGALEQEASHCSHWSVYYCMSLCTFTSRMTDFLPTGFSFGGLLACAIAAEVWNTPYIGSDLLKENLVCITFAQPHVSVPMLVDVVRQRAELASTIHGIYSQDDVVPRLMRFLDESWSSQTLLDSKESKPGTQLIVPDKLKAVRSYVTC